MPRWRPRSWARTLAATALVLSGITTEATGADAPARVERYRYRAYPKGNDDPRRRESIRVEIRHAPDRADYYANIIRPDATERYRVTTDTTGAFVSAVRSLFEDGDRDTDSLRVTGDGATVIVTRHSGDDTDTDEIDVPANKRLAVDASLLLWLRRFPFDSGAEIDVFMVDFSRRHIGTVVRQKAVETIDVPAGRFECYRMEVAVQLPIFKPKVTFWITTESPHFLVRHEGRRGPFTASYRTELVSLETAP